MDQDARAVVISEATGPTLELAIAAWLDSKSKRSGSRATFIRYHDVITSFRRELHDHGLELDDDWRAVGLVAQAWASQRRRTTRQGKAGAQDVTNATYNNRLAILSSFYTFVRKRGLLPNVKSPIEALDRRPEQEYRTAKALDALTVKRRLAAIDTQTLDGSRDYSLLVVGLQTGRRASELAQLCYGDIAFAGDGTVTLTWRRCKGGKVMSDTLPQLVSVALIDWLTRAYGDRLSALDSSAPVWLALDPWSRRRHVERTISAQAMGHICERRLGTSHVHVLRHTFAAAMADLGAHPTVIRDRLGHSSLATTTLYLSALASSRNPFAEQLAGLFDVSG